MSLVHTFCDFARLVPQTAAEEFGSKSTLLFQCGSSFSQSSGLAAYAVTDALCAIQPVAGTPAQVNIILKPTAEVLEDVPVAYFILRGIAKSDFFSTANNVDTLFATAPAGNQWLQRIVDNQAAYNLEMKTGYDARKKPGDPAYVPAPLTAAALGWAPETGSWVDADALETIFTGCTLQKVQAGWQLGTFAAGTSLEVILRTDAWQPDLAYARSAAGTITMPASAGRNSFSAGQVEDYEFKLRRERVLAFLDPCTFYALAAADNQLANRPAGATAPVAYASADVQPNVLAKFHEPTKVYLDLRNHLGQSLNFYNDYLGSGTSSAQLQLTGPGSSATTYPYHDGRGWPLLVLRPTDRAALNLAGSAAATLQLALPAQSGGHPMVFVATKHLYRAAKLQRQEFIEPTGGLGAFAGAIPLQIPGGLGTYLKLAYFVRYDVSQFATTAFNPAKLVKQDTLDNLLSLRATPPPRPAGYLVSTSSAEVQYVGCTSLTTGTDYLMRSGEAQDDIGSYFFAYMVQPSESAGQADLTKIRVPLNLRQLRVQNTDFLSYLSTTLGAAWIYDADSQKNSVNYKCLTLQARSHNYSLNPLQSSVDDLLLIGVTTDETSQIRSKCNDKFLKNSKNYICCLSHELTNDDDELILFKLKMGVQGIQFDANTNAGQLETLDTGITLISRDGKNYFSESFVVAFRTANTPVV